MQKRLNIILGVIVGIAASAFMVFGVERQVAFGSINWWDEVVAYDDFFEWKDVFSPSAKGKNLYALVHAKLLQYPTKDAVSEVAKNAGLTRAEARSVIAGNVMPLMRAESGNSNLSQEKALQMLEGMQEQFQFLKAVFELQHELDLYTTPSEMFANNDLGDSGFDLIHDLSVIEELLFVDVVENTVGKPFGGQKDSPYMATDGYKTLPPYIEQKNPSAIGKLSSALEVDADGDGENDAEVNVSDGAISAGAAEITIGESVVDVEVLDEDICPVPADDLVAALEKYNSDKPDETSSDVADNGADGDTGGVYLGSGSGIGSGLDGLDNGIVKANDSGLPDTDLVPAPADEWRSAWCPGLSFGGGENPSGSTFGKEGFDSLGGVVNSLIGQSAGAMAAAGNENFAAHIAVCFETEFVMRTVSSYQPGAPCVLCELEKINEILKKTLSHSLVPNKATGNLFESAKCKDSYGAFLDMQFIALSAPIPTPSNDDAIYGKNVFEEWNAFVKRYEPLIFPPIDVNYSQKFESASDVSQAEFLRSVNKDLDNGREKALSDIANLERSYDATNTSSYLQIVVAELDAMTNFFNNYNKLYNKTYDVCKDIGKKKTLD